MSASLLISDVVAEGYGEHITGIAPQLDWSVVTPRGVDGDLGRVQVAFLSGDLIRAPTPPQMRIFMDALGKCPGLRWLHSVSAGVDHPFFQKLLGQGVRLTNSSGSSASSIAQYAM